MDKITSDARVYTDVQGLDKLRAQYKSDPNGVKKEVSQQFEALFIQMVLRSMRDANQALSSGLFASDDMSMYQDMFDKQLSLSFSQQGIGFAKMIEENIDHQLGAPDKAALAQLSYEKSQASEPSVQAVKADRQPQQPKMTQEPKKEQALSFSSPKDFIDKLSGIAKHAAHIIGVHPAVILAQAALETDWGKKIITHAKGVSSFNLFNIKSDGGWQKDKVLAPTLEQKNGIIVKQQASFRSYESFHESFMDYANLITKNPRYQKAVAHAAEPKAYTEALQEAGYATDSQYANKIIEILKSQPFKAMLETSK